MGETLSRRAELLVEATAAAAASAIREARGGDRREMTGRHRAVYRGLAGRLSEAAAEVLANPNVAGCFAAHQDLLLAVLLRGMLDPSPGRSGHPAGVPDVGRSVLALAADMAIEALWPDDPTESAALASAIERCA